MDAIFIFLKAAYNWVLTIKKKNIIYHLQSFKMSSTLGSQNLYKNNNIIYCVRKITNSFSTRVTRVGVRVLILIIAIKRGTFIYNIIWWCRFRWIDVYFPHNANPFARLRIIIILLYSQYNVCNTAIGIWYLYFRLFAVCTTYKVGKLSGFGPQGIHHRGRSSRWLQYIHILFGLEETWRAAVYMSRRACYNNMMVKRLERKAGKTAYADLS